MAASASIAAFLRLKSSRKTFSSPTSTAKCSPQFKEVLLHDWWLIKADSDYHGKRLAVEGFTAEKSQGQRRFNSAPIIKRHDAVTLQTADGITVTVVSGHLNLTSTLSNGFPLKVYNNFVFGFPYYWEEFAALSFDGLETTPENSEHVSLNAFPVTVLRDLSIGNLEHHESSLESKNILDDILQSTGTDTSSSDGELGSKKASPVNIKRMVTTPDEASLNHAKSKAQRKRKGSNDTTIAKPSTSVKRRLMQENSDIADIGALTSGPVTRSRSRLIMRN